MRPDTTVPLTDEAAARAVVTMLRFVACLCEDGSEFAYSLCRCADQLLGRKGIDPLPPLLRLVR